MKIRACILLLFTLVVPWVAPGGAFAVTYYIAGDGSDQNNDGLSVDSPWQSISKINSLSSDLTVGATFLFKRGDVFRGEIRLAGYTNNVTQLFANNSQTPL